MKPTGASITISCAQHSKQLTQQHPPHHLNSLDTLITTCIASFCYFIFIWAEMIYIFNFYLLHLDY